MAQPNNFVMLALLAGGAFAAYSMMPSKSNRRKAAKAASIPTPDPMKTG